MDLTNVGNGAIFEGTKGSIFCDFTSRVIIPLDDDGDMTYYKRRSKDELLPLVGGTGQPSPPPRPRRPSGGRRRGNFGIEMGDNGFPIIKLDEDNLPPALGDPNPGLATADSPYKPSTWDLFMLDWVKACKGESNDVKKSAGPSNLADGQWWWD